MECVVCKKWMHSQCGRLDDQDLMACCVCVVLYLNEVFVFCVFALLVLRDVFHSG